MFFYTIATLIVQQAMGFGNMGFAAGHTIGYIAGFRDAKEEK